jgi:hypothetical protein
MSRYTRKQNPSYGWAKLSPKGRGRTRMYKKCGQKCFLGKKTSGNKRYPSFPICAKGTCRVNTKGLHAAYVRAKQWGNKTSSYKGRARPRFSRKVYKRIASKARTLLRKRGVKVGK